MMKKYSLALLIFCMGSAFGMYDPSLYSTMGADTRMKKASASKVIARDRKTIEKDIQDTEKKIADIDKRKNATTNTTVKTQLQKDRALQVQRLQRLETELKRTK